MNMIHDVHQAEKNIIIFVTHNMDDVVRVSDKVLVMDRGKLVTVGTPAEVFSRKLHLERFGLDVPPVTAFIRELYRKGIPVDPETLTMQQAADEIVAFLRKKASQ